eukprot:TRINITY_DN2040_c0_g1_i1.p1 TRINITY_DN2040_c0_g1~~TRINITY_DN2040_c0_g1_i1.p1  ORF type:complete len:492 (-),score=143.55 TRINITY_DN2040_c0_g1_i1:360-1634(-)
MEEKATACNMIFCFVSELKEHFFDYVEPIAKIMIPLITFYYHDEVRSASTQTMAPLLRAATAGLEKRGKPKQEVFGLFDHIFGKLLEAAKAEPDVEISFHMVEGIHESIEIMGENCLSEDKLSNLIELMKTLFHDFNERRSDRLAKGKEQDVDEEEAENLERENEKEEDLLAGLSEIITKLCKYQKAPFTKYFDVLLPYILTLLAPTRRAHDRQIGICVFDDVIEHIGLPSLPYLQHVLPSLAQSITDADPGVRQAAVYGAGVIAQTFGAQVASLIPELTKQLVGAIQQPDSRNDENVFATENAISALGKIILYQPSSINVAELLPLWFSLLPVLEDKVESPVTYGLLCTFVESNNPHIFGPGGQNLPRLVTILVDVLGSDLVDEPTSTRVVNILKQMKTLLPMDQLGAILNADQKAKWTQYVA